MTIYRYSEWDSTRSTAGLEKDALVNELAHGMLRDGDLEHVLWKMQRQDLSTGEQRLTGLQKLLRRLLDAKEKQSEKLDLSAVLENIETKIDDIIKMEQAGIRKKLEQAQLEAEKDTGTDEDKQRLRQIQQTAAANLAKLDNLPSEITVKIKELQNHDFSDENALRQFRELMESGFEAPHSDSTLEGATPYFGQESISFDEALKLMETLQEMDTLSGQIEDAKYEGIPVDIELVRKLLGDKAVVELETPGVTDVLEEANFIRRKDGEFELTPLGMRKIGQKALTDIFSQLRQDTYGGHKTGDRGNLGKRGEETKRFEFGDNFDVDLKQTIMNALLRQQRKLPIQMEVSDFEVYESERSARSATVLMIDLSLSMSVKDNFYAAKHMALALDGLIRSQFHGDIMHIVGFSSYAREIKAEDLIKLRLDQSDPYTNIQHGLVLAEKLLAKYNIPNKQIIIVTDGEPTAHVEEGQISYHFSTGARTLQLTLREVENCTRQDITINTFMLGESNINNAFITRIAKINKGRVFFTSPDGLGKYVLVDYFSNRRKGMK